MKLPTITFDQEALSRFGKSIEKEWLITNGLGGYASSSILGINTRKYHALLVAALHPPGERTVCLSKLDEDVILENDIYRLGANDFHDVIYPQGYKLIKQFSIAPYPKYSYDLAGINIDKTIFLHKNKNTASVIYNVNNKKSSGIKVRIYPLLTCRYFHKVVDRRKKSLNFTQKSSSNEVEVVFRHPQAAILCRSTNGEFKEKINWVDHLYYRDEAERVESSYDDCFQPGYFEVEVPPLIEKEFALTTSLSQEIQTAREILDSIGNTNGDIDQALGHELYHRGNLLDNFYSLHPSVPMSEWLNWILFAADSFIVENSVGDKSIIAGYHWFEPWGRDTFISLPGLLLATSRFSEAKSIFQNFIHLCKNGLIPNYITDKFGEPAYNTVDATLWYVNALFQYLKYTRDFAFVKEELWRDLQAIIDHHMKGTLFGIQVDYDGLLMHGSRLTWMDAAVGGKEITPRTGKAVEIQALWYNTLRIMQLIANKFGEKVLAEKYALLADKAKKSFNEKFWNEKLARLFDVLENSGGDPSLRPNQIFAVSLDHLTLMYASHKMSQVHDSPC